MRPCPLLFPCPHLQPLRGPLLVRKPWHFSRGHPLPRQLQTAGGFGKGCIGTWSILERLSFCWRLVSYSTRCTAACSPFSCSSSLPSSSMALTWVLEHLLPQLSSQSYTSCHSSVISSKFFCSYSLLICCVHTFLGRPKHRPEVKLWHKNDVFDENFGVLGSNSSP